MARMIPSVLDPGTRSPGEREIFHRLRDEPSTEGWIVLHSLLLADHPTRIEGEADFVAIVPGKGVVVLEVKACRSLRVDAGVWHYGRQEKPDPRGPFRQASEAMHAIRSFMHRERPDLDGVVYWSAVTFPYVPFAMRSEEWHPWQVIDGPAFRRAPFSQSLERVLDAARTHLLRVPSARWFDRASITPTSHQAEGIASTLRPIFEVVESPKLRRRREREELLAYTAEQYEALDSMTANPRVVFEGPAGTGKTLLALEATRRAALDGQRVMLACHTGPLGKWLRERSNDFTGDVWAGTLGEYMQELVARDAEPGRPADEGSNHALEDAALETILGDPPDHPFDLIILDEAQDLMTETMLDVIDMSVEGGLAAGSWWFFGDFERQALFGSDVTLEAFIEGRAPGATVHSLRVNCRNTPRIAALTYLLGGLTPDYRRIRRPDDGVEADFAFYGSPEASPEGLVKLLDTLYAEGYRGGEIAVLSSDEGDPVAARVSTAPWKDRLRPLAEAEGGHVPYASVQEFKGLEAPVVIVTDLEDITTDEGRALLYVAVTRPLSRLFLLLPDRMREQILSSLASIESET